MNKRKPDHIEITRTTIIELLVLKLISAEPLPVVELALKFKEMHVPIPLTTLYKTLQSLRTRSLASKGYEELDVGAARKCFSCTKNGHRYMRELESEWDRLSRIMRYIGQPSQFTSKASRDR